MSTGLPADALAESLPVALRQRLEIVKALATGASILLLDEPSAVLAPAEVDELIGLVRGFVREGGAAVLITHKLREVIAAADRVTVLRQGAVTFQGPVTGQTEVSLAQAMIGGGEAGVLAGVSPRVDSKPAGRDTSGNTPDKRRQALSLGEHPIHSGEITGVAAVVGNGQRELLRAHLDQPGVAFIPEDRSTEGLIGELSITENIVLGLPDDPRWARGFRLDWPAARSRTRELLSSFNVAATGPDARVATLSGGNQQKVVLARALERHPRVLIAENPTRGLDVHSTAEVHARLRGAAAEGVAVVVYSSDLDEVLDLADRVLVVHAGRVQVAPADADRRLIGEMMLGIGGGEG